MCIRIYAPPHSYAYMPCACAHTCTHSRGDRGSGARRLQPLALMMIGPVASDDHRVWHRERSHLGLGAAHDLK